MVSKLPELYERKKLELKPLGVPAHLPSVDVEKVPQKGNVFVLGFISILTLWIYPAFWYMRKSEEYRNLGTDKHLSRGLATFYLAVEVLFILSIVILPFTVSNDPGRFNQNVTTAQMVTLILVIIFFVVAAILLITLALKSRAIINEALRNKGEKNISLFFTILFGVLYLQYEINKIIDDKEKNPVAAPWIVLVVLLALVGLGIWLWG